MGHTIRRPRRRARCLAGLATALAGLLAVASGAQTTPPLPSDLGSGLRGTLSGPWSCAEIPAQRYQLYLPSGYDPSPDSAPAPLLFVLDARGRAPQAAEPFVAAAEELGWIIVSSYNTASDGALQPNLDAIQALADEVFARLRADPHRVYLAGFSGTARFSWGLAAGNPGRFAGVVAASGGTGDGQPPRKAVPFPVFLTAGEPDFNPYETDRRAHALVELGSPHRLAIFPGGHSWPPAELAAEALEWLEVQALARGLRDPDPLWLHRVIARWRQRAEELEGEGRWVAALRAWGGLERDLRELAGGDEKLAETGQAAGAALARLRHRRDVREALNRRHKALADESTYDRPLAQALTLLRQGDGVIPSVRVARILRLEALQKEARQGGDADGSAPDEAALAARRMLERAFVQLAFYLPRELIDQDAARAVASLETALLIKPQQPFAHYRLAVAYLRSGRSDRALESLEEAVAAGVSTAALANDPELEALRGTEGFTALLGEHQGPPDGSP